MARTDSILRSMLRGSSMRDIDEPLWSKKAKRRRDLFSGITETLLSGIDVHDRVTKRNKNAVLSGINLLPDLALLIRDEDDLINYENMSKKLAKDAGRYTETAPYSAFISSASDNISEDYYMYTKSMESASMLFNSGEYIDSAEGWDNLDDEVARMVSDDGETPRYKGNGTNLYLVEQQDKINSLIGRIKNSSKGTQFRYNKAGNEYTDQEVLDKLDKHQKRIAIAVQASYGDGIITRDEADFIMTGNVSAYQDAKDTAVKQIETEIKRLNRLEESISKQISKHIVKKGTGISSSIMEGIRDQVNMELKGTGEELTSPDINTLLEDLSERQSLVYDEKVKLKRAFRGWEGKKYLQAPKVSESDKKKYEESILSDDVGDISPLSTEITGITSQGKATVDVTKKEAPKLTYDPAMGDTIAARNKNRVEKYGITIEQLGDLQDAWEKENTGQTLDTYLDSMFAPAEGDNIEEEKVLSNKEKTLKKSVDNFDLLKTAYNKASDNLSNIEKEFRLIKRSVDRGFEYDKDKYNDLKSRVNVLKGTKETLFKNLEKALKRKQEARGKFTASSSEEYYRKKATEYLKYRGLKKTDKNWELAMEYVRKSYSPNWTKAISEPIVSGAENISQYLRSILK